MIETLIDLVLSGAIIYGKELKKLKLTDKEKLKEKAKSFFNERIAQFKQTYWLSLFFLLNNVFGVKGLSQVSIPM